MSDAARLPGKFVWHELETLDPERAQRFYGGVFGWRVGTLPKDGATYRAIRAAADDVAIGGWVPAPKGRSRSRWTAYVSVDDVDAAVKAAAANGGRVVEPPHEIAGVGRSARIADPEGAELAVIRNASGDGTDLEAKPGRFFWDELRVARPEKTLAFYEEVLGFGHEAVGAPGRGRYWVLSRGGAGRGGVANLDGDHEDPHWLPYVRVDDVDATVARAKRHGAKVTTGPTEIRGIGRYGVLTDPTGAPFAVMKPKPR
jgi:predicted enzyme related to lactoylglutathione lyase